MQQGIKKLQWLEYLKVVFLEILNTPLYVGFLQIRSHIYIRTCIHASRLTVVSDLWGQEEARPVRQTSELFTGSTTVKLVNALNKPP